jgi:hypothetical protein
LPPTALRALEGVVKIFDRRRTTGTFAGVYGWILSVNLFVDWEPFMKELDDEGSACCLKCSDGLGVTLPIDQGKGFVGGLLLLLNMLVEAMAAPNNSNAAAGVAWDGLLFDG